MLDKRQRQDLDNHITGHYGEDQFRETPGESLDAVVEQWLNTQDEDTVIGFLLDGRHVVCHDCLLHHDRQSTMLYRVNIGAYTQGCHECSKILNPGRTAWPELFDPRECKVC